MPFSSGNPWNDARQHGLQILRENYHDELASRRDG
jgi:hypothetical protein